MPFESYNVLFKLIWTDNCNTWCKIWYPIWRHQMS